MAFAMCERQRVPNGESSPSLSDLIQTADELASNEELVRGLARSLDDPPSGQMSLGLDRPLDRSPIRGQALKARPIVSTGDQSKHSLSAHLFADLAELMALASGIARKGLTCARTGSDEFDHR